MVFLEDFRFEKSPMVYLGDFPHVNFPLVFLREIFLLIPRLETFPLVYLQFKYLPELLDPEFSPLAYLLVVMLEISLQKVHPSLLTSLVI